MLSILVKSLKYHDPCSIFIIFVPEILKCTTFRHTHTHTHQKKKKKKNTNRIGWKEEMEYVLYFDFELWFHVTSYAINLN